VDPIAQDFRKLRKEAEEKGLFKANIWFFVGMLFHILAFEGIAWAILYLFGNNWITWLIASVALCTAQAQAGWLQHDLGHLSVFFKSSRLNHAAHHFVIGAIKGASSRWWNFRHFRHHAKPNIIAKDPDVAYCWLFLFGKKIPNSWGSRKRGFMPYTLQHFYWFLFGPPIILTVYFHIEIIYYVLYYFQVIDILAIIVFVARYQLMFAPLVGGGWAVMKLYMFARFLESHWFTWVTQMNHIPMDIDRDTRKDWVSLQLQSTCNVEQSLFNDWFTGHLNFQIEHHLFPTMPRNNLHLIAPVAQALCKKHGIKYESKGLWQAFADIVESLKQSGQIYYDAYHHR